MSGTHRPRFQSEAEHWEAWERGETRCPYCVGVSMRDFEAMCDCSRFSLETTGKPLVIQVVGRPDTAQVVKPHAITEPSAADLAATVRDALVSADSAISHLRYRGTWPLDDYETGRLIALLRSTSLNALDALVAERAELEAALRAAAETCESEDLAEEEAVVRASHIARAALQSGGSEG